MNVCIYRNEGLFVGPSAALNVVAAIKLSRLLQQNGISNPRIVTILCDGGDRYVSKMYNNEWLIENNLVPKYSGNSLDFIM